MGHRIFNTLDEAREWFEMLGRMEGREQGYLTGTTDAVLRVLEVRGLADVDYAIRWVCDRCTDQEAADELLTRVITVESLEDLENHYEEVDRKAG